MRRTTTPAPFVCSPRWFTAEIDSSPQADHVSDTASDLDPQHQPHKHVPNPYARTVLAPWPTDSSTWTATTYSTSTKPSSQSTVVSISITLQTQSRLPRSTCLDNVRSLPNSKAESVQKRTRRSMWQRKRPWRSLTKMLSVQLRTARASSRLEQGSGTAVCSPGSARPIFSRMMVQGQSRRRCTELPKALAFPNLPSVQQTGAPTRTRPSSSRKWTLAGSVTPATGFH